ncbi:MAG: hypothetical protein U0992_22930 [Planctomycetaceae bacterium]
MPAAPILSDEGLGLLPLEQLENLEVQNSTITADRLRQLSRCRELEDLALDGAQLDARD